MNTHVAHTPPETRGMNPQTHTPPRMRGMNTQTAHTHHGTRG